MTVRKFVAKGTTVGRPRKMPPQRNPGNDKRIEYAAKVYATVIHILSDIEAAQKIGRTTSGVRDYRQHHPEAQPVGWATAAQSRKITQPIAKPTTPSGEAKTRVYEAMLPDGRVNRVSLRDDTRVRA